MDFNSVLECVRVASFCERHGYFCLCCRLFCTGIIGLILSHASDLAILNLMYSYEPLWRVLFIHVIWDEICVFLSPSSQLFFECCDS